MAHKFLRATIASLFALSVGLSCHAAWAIDNSTSDSRASGVPMGSSNGSASATETKYPQTFPRRVSAQADAAAALAAGTYGGPITQYCEKLAKQLKRTWTKVELKDNKNSSAFCRIDENGKIIEAVTDDKNFKDYLLNQQPIKDPPISAGKPLWLTANLHKEKDNAEVELKDVDFGPYIRNVQRNIKHYWYPPGGQAKKQMSVQFKVKANGEVSDIKVVKESGSPVCDAAGIEAVSKAAPFGPMPDGAPAEIDVQFAFDYNVFSNDASKTLR